MSNVFSGKLNQSRSWTVGIGIGAAVLAAILLVVYLNRYRTSVNATKADTPVLVAKNLIPLGTSGSVIAEKALYQVASYPKDDVKVGAIADPAYLTGRIALVDIFPGQQITTAEFSTGTTEALTTKISGRERAVAIPASGAKNLVGIAQTGDRVDVYYGTGASGGQLLGLLAPNVLLLSAPTSDGAPAIMKLGAVAAQTMALASDTGTLWFLLRPAGDAKNPPKKVITTQQLLALVNAQPKKKG
jgi:Flp pilus assembly protein CpaB